MSPRLCLQAGSRSRRALSGSHRQSARLAQPSFLCSDLKPATSICPSFQYRPASTLWMRQPDSVLRKKLGLPPKPLDVEEQDRENWKIDPYDGQPEGLTLLRRMGLLAVSQLERRKWIFDPYNEEFIERPTSELWKKYRGPPDQPAEDDAAIDALPEMKALRIKYEQALEEERLAQREREKADNYLQEGGDDPFTKAVYLDDKFTSNWDRLRSPGLFAAAARTEEHRLAFIEKGWLKLRDQEVGERQEREGVVLSKLEKTRRDKQWAADWADSEGDWEEFKQDEMEAWRALDKARDGGEKEESQHADEQQ